MEYSTNLLVIVAGFAVVALASKQIGQFFARFKLPLISGFLFAGIITGPFVLNLIPAEAVENLRFVDEISLAFIAFAAGSELYLHELKGRFKSIVWVTLGNTIAIPVIGTLSVFLLTNIIPFTRAMSVPSRVGVALIAGAILVARSPSSAIAIVNELRAKGPFTQTVLGVTVIIDVIVIILFAISTSVADALLTGLGFDLEFVILLLVELSTAIALGYVVGKFLNLVLSSRVKSLFKIALILITGYGVFVLSEFVRDVTQHYFAFEVFLEPLLVCMVGSFVLTNFSNYRTEFLKILDDVAPPIYIIFFTLIGASLALDVLVQTWPIAVALFAVRLAGIFAGSFSGGVLAGDPLVHNRISWLAYITQAGVGLGLAKEVAVEFPEFGTSFATLIISVIVLNQIIGPPFFKWAINKVGEAHPRGTHEFDGVRDAIVFGLEGQSLALARQLCSHGWQVKIAAYKEDSFDPTTAQDSTFDIYPISSLNLDALHQLKTGQAEAIVTMLGDEENYRICELAYEHFGTETLVVRLNDRANFGRFYALGAYIVEPATAIPSLLDHIVRSPSAASLLLGTDDSQDIIDIEVRDPSLHGVPIRDLRLPLDTLILSVYRDGHTLISHGHTCLKLGDRVTAVGSLESLDKLMLRFEE